MTYERLPGEHQAIAGIISILEGFGGASVRLKNIYAPVEFLDGLFDRFCVIENRRRDGNASVQYATPVVQMGPLI